MKLDETLTLAIKALSIATEQRKQFLSDLRGTLMGWNTLEERLQITRKYLEANRKVEEANALLQQCLNGYDTFGPDVDI